MIRSAKKEEIDILIEVLKLSFENASIDKKTENVFGNVTGLSWWERKSLDIKRDFSSNPEGLFVKVLDNKIVGFVTNLIEKESKTGTISHLMVLPEYRGKGIGKEFIRYSIAYLKSSGIKLLKISVIDTNTGAFELYKKMGFKEVAKLNVLAMPIGNKG